MSALKAPQALGDYVSLADTLSALGQELERVRVSGLRIEQTICAIAVRTSLDSALIEELQHLDAALQHIAALRDFSEQLALQCDDDVSIELSPALERVTLADVRRRLAQQDSHFTEEGWEIL